MYSRPFSDNRSASVTVSCCVKVLTFRRGSWRSCEAIEANCSSSEFDRASSAARCSSAELTDSSSSLTTSSRSFVARTSSAERNTLRPSSSARMATIANAAKIAHGIHLRSPETLANRGPVGALSTIRSVELASGIES